VKIELGSEVPTFRAGETPGYEVHDITVVTTDGKRASADVVYSVDGGDLMTVRVEYTDDRYAPQLCHTLPLDLPAGFISEIMGDCREACRATYKKLN
jgi:hypothetical protein